eukprot:TRINITY_DN23741_c0_g1_i1.p1 TRINITY_DN23741_c0_g1~~TRINITY_DN23741_c0_g1_i1.p1  ORF type:complete len:549 (-),score=114.60 TRINITY_DN23741_c0_g1_i1:104-1690(-)
MAGYATDELEEKLTALSLQATRPLNFKLATSEISKKACPGSADTNAKYEKLMQLVDVELRGRPEFLQVNSEADARELIARQPSASVHVIDATRMASDAELLLGGIHTEAFIRAMKERTASIEESDEELLLDGVNAKNDPTDLLHACKEKDSDGVKTIFHCGEVSAGWSEDTEAAARTGVAALIDCARDVFEGRYMHGFVLARPPSHHAVGNAELARNGSQKDMPLGFCHLNSIASAVAHLRSSQPQLRVCIFDFDVHPGNGNEDTFWDDPGVLTISIHQQFVWPGEDTCHAEYVGGPNAVGSVFNFPIPFGAGDTEYFHVVKDYVFPQIKEFVPGIIFVAAGYDALAGDAYADQELTPDWYGWCISELMSLDVAPLVLNLEGGYTPDNVVRAIGRTIDALAGKRPEDFLSCMNIEPLSEKTAVYFDMICDDRRASLQEKRGAADAKARPPVKPEPHVKAAMAFKADADEKKAAIEAKANALTGKVNIKARSKMMRQAKDILKSARYVDACLVISGQAPKFKNFVAAKQ